MVVEIIPNNDRRILSLHRLSNQNLRSRLLEVLDQYLPEDGNSMVVCFITNKDKSAYESRSVENFQLDSIPKQLKKFLEQGRFANDLRTEKDITNLTNREKSIIKYIMNGCTNKEIALDLKISEQTVKSHVSSILHKLHARDRAHAVSLALLLDLI